MQNRTYLDTSDGMVAYARDRGAKFDKAVGLWFVEGEVPNDLIGLIPKKPNKTVHVVAPSCPACGSHMVERRRQSDGNLFWGCSQFPRCKGIVTFEDHLEYVEPWQSKSVVDFLKTNDAFAKPSPSKDKKRSSMPPELQAEVERVVAFAAKVRGGSSRAEKWLSSPKVALKGKIPIHLMTSMDGCLLVEKLLLETQE